ncbi:MAG: hypothetical protein ACI35Q_02830 [Marinilabiliaceae bacterium]
MEVLNPIYDTSFKYLMDDKASATILLSALLRKKVTSLTPQKIEKRPAVPGDCWLLIYSLGYQVGTVADDGREETIRVEIRKIWLQTGLAAFHFYLADKFDPDEPVLTDGGAECRPVVIYILAHEICDTDEPVTYCRGGEITDYYGAPLRPATGGRFVSGLRGDAIIVQTPRLPKCPRNAAERIMYFFDQRLALSSDSRFIVVPDSDDDDSEPAVFLRRLCCGACTADIRRQMELEREYLIEIQARDEEILLQKAVIAMHGEKLKEQREMAEALNGQREEITRKLYRFLSE